MRILSDHESAGHGAVASTAAQGAIDPNFVRGGSGPNGKPSLTVDEAGEQITRGGYTLNGQNVTNTPVNITYAFRATNGGVMPEDTGSFSTFNAQQIHGAEQALAAWADVANVTFTRVGSGDSGPSAYSDNATMLFGNYATGMSGAAAFAYYPTDNSPSNLYSSDVWVNNSYDYNAAPQLLNYGQQALLHEIGHALGLQHPGDYNAGGNSSISYDASADYYEDTRQYSVMSYWDEANSGAHFQGLYASAPLLDDIAAIQRLYGANLTTRTGDTVYGYNSNADQAWFKASGSIAPLIFAVWDAGGIDTFDFSGYGAGGIIDLRATHFSSIGGLTGNISIAEGVVIENAIGGRGNETIYGNEANNIIEGGDGSDTINGGAGNDTASYAHASRAVTVNLSVSGTQAVSAADTGEVLISIENLIGSAYDDTLIGNIGNNRLDGGAGNDMAGFLGATSGVTVSLAVSGAQAVGGGQGSDTFVSIEGLLGSNYNDTLTGNAASNVLEGAGGNDTLNGGDGLDTAAYTRATSAVTVNLAISGAQSVGGGMGSDTLVSIENLSGSNFNDTLTGTGNANILNGGQGNDTLDGAGGYDTVTYQTADYSISVDLSISGQQIISYSQGNDTLISIENVVASDFNDRLTGNAGSNILDGGSGSDTIDYNKATSGITVDLSLAGAQTIGGGQGQDRLISIENVVASQFNDSLTGSSGDNIFEGGAGNDVINGGGGFDTVVYNGVTGVTVDLSITTAQAIGAGMGSDTLSNIEAIVGTYYGDKLTGNTGANTFTGGAGDDVIDGGAGIDTVAFSTQDYGVTVDLTRTTAQAIGAGLGNDTLINIENIIGTLSNDFLTGTSATTYLQGGGSEDTLTIAGKLSTAAVIDGGDGYDNLWLDGDYSSGLVLNGTSIVNVEVLNFKAGNDYSVTLRDGAVKNSMYDTMLISGETLGVNDALYIDGSAETTTRLGLSGGAGVDTIKGGQAADTISMNNHLAGADKIDGGLGTDTIYLNGNYASGLTFTANTIQNIEEIYLSLGFSYKFTLNDGNIAAGQNLRIRGEDLGASDTLTIDGSAEKDGVVSIDSAAGHNILTGGAQNDGFYIKGGVATINGGGGDDTIFLNGTLLTNDRINGGAGNDYVGLYDSGNPVTLVMSATTMINVEQLVVSGGIAHVTTHDATVAAGQQLFVNSMNSLTFDGSAETNGTFLVVCNDESDNILTGAGDDNLSGFGGNDVLNGGGGADLMWGGTGNDTYYVDNSGDKVSEEYGILGGDGTFYDSGGAERVFSSITYSLGKYVENLTLTGLANISATGNSLANILTGNTGNNILDGGQGADIMAGGLGNDIYYIDNANDVTTELSGQGTDSVLTSLSWTLANNVENLYLTGLDNLTGKGNTLNNLLIGTDGNNTLNGAAGADTLNGGYGDDTYIIDNAGDAVIEGSGNGNDTIYATMSYSLTGKYVESLFLMGTDNINASGNAGINLLVGNTGANVLNGGADADTMNGGAGDDIYYVDNAGDVVVEGNGGGTDTIYSAISYSLGGRYVEKLFLTGSDNINATGNAGDNLLVGNSGNNIFNGGAGADSLNGGLGNDTYYVDNAGDIVIEGNGGGSDTVISMIDWSLSGSYVENLTLSGSASINATGNALANTLMGNAGNNTLNGGTSNDTLTGGGGDDIFWFGAGSGLDTITDFSNDMINLNAYSQGVANGAGIVIAQTGGDTTIDLGGGNIITLTGIAPADLNGHIVW